MHSIQSPPPRESADRRDRSADSSTAQRVWKGPGALSFRFGPGLDLGARARLWLAASVLATLGVVVIGFVGDLALVRAIAVSVFLFLQLGIAPFLLLGRIKALWFSILAITTGLSTTVAGGYLMSTLGVWAPVPALALASLVTVVLLVPSMVRDWRTLAVGSGHTVKTTPGTDSRPRASTSGKQRTGRWIAGLTTVGLVLVIVTARAGQTSPEPGGLVSSLGPAWIAAVAVLVASAAWAWRAGTSPAYPVLALSGIVVLSQALAYGTPAVMSAARHVGIVDYIRVNQGAAPGLDIYQAWSGLFAGVAWVCDAAGIDDALTVAAIWPIILSPALALAVAALASRWVTGSARAWLAAAIFALTGTLNIIYFSPQSVALLITIVIFALAVEPRRARSAGPRAPFRLRTLLQPLGFGRFALIVYLSCVMTVTHQLSPYLAGGALIVLVVFGYVRPWWLPAVVLVPAFLFAMANSGVLGRFVSLEAFGRLWENIQPPDHSFTQYSTPLVTSLAFAIPAAILVLVGCVGVGTALLVKARQSMAVAAAAASPLMLFVVTNYGQEGIFRAVLFASPWLAVLAAGFPWAAKARLGRDRAAMLVGVALGALVAGNVFGQTALDWNRMISADSAEATLIYETSAPPGSVILLTGSGNATPQQRTARYMELEYVNRESLGGYPDPDRSYDAAQDVRDLTRELVTTRNASVYYALVSDSIGAYGDRYGFQPYEDYQALTRAMEASSEWVPIFIGDTTTLYILQDSAVNAG